jgi:hypothetical protein
LDGQHSNCTEGIPANADQTKKCEFYCPDGWHKESDENCHKNSCKSENETSMQVTGGKTVTYTPGCIDTAGDVKNGHNGSMTDTKTVRSADGYGTRTFTATFTCTNGVRTKSNENPQLQCDGGYRERPNGAGEQDNECLPTSWSVGSW